MRNTPTVQYTMCVLPYVCSTVSLHPKKFSNLFPTNNSYSCFLKINTNYKKHCTYIFIYSIFYIVLCSVMFNNVSHASFLCLQSLFEYFLMDLNEVLTHQVCYYNINSVELKLFLVKRAFNLASLPSKLNTIHITVKSKTFVNNGKRHE